MNVYVGNRLPSTYQEVEYIQSNGNQYFIVGNSFSTDYITEAKFQYLSSSGNDHLFGVSQSSPNYRYAFGAGTPNFFTISGGSSWTDVGSLNYNINTVILNKSNISINGTSYSSSYSLGTINKGLGIFCYNAGPLETHSGNRRLFYLKVYNQSSTVLYNLIPCYRKSDGVIGMYDLVNSVFYTNSGTGTFSKGSDVTMAELKNAYIGCFSLPRPAIKSSTQDGYTISADSAAGNPPDMYNATDNNPSTYWLSNYGTGSYSHWLKMELPTPSAATSIFLKARTNSNANEIRFPSAIKLQGSNDDSSWTDIQSWTRSSIVASGTEFNYTFNNTTSYKYYKILVTPSQWVSGYGGYAVLAEWNLS